jgi:hypothetical protein
MADGTKPNSPDGTAMTPKEFLQAKFAEDPMLAGIAPLLRKVYGAKSALTILGYTGSLSFDTDGDDWWKPTPIEPIRYRPTECICTARELFAHGCTCGFLDRPSWDDKLNKIEKEKHNVKSTNRY